jgi:protein-L-isoaspartate(D-aspartate) O-methyltransferase
VEVIMGKRLSTLFGVCIGFQLLLAGCRPGVEGTPTQSNTAKNLPAEDAVIDAAATDEIDSYAEARAWMVQDGIIAWGVEDENVIEVMGKVPRHLFVPEEYLDRAYFNHPLPIGYGQTISQPYIVALMTQELEVSEGDRVLEVGTGSGYQAAVLAELGITVYTIEIIGPLAEQATQQLDEAGYSHVTVRHDDGYFGWEDEAPFDAIIVTAAPDHVPQPLLGQLKIGGILVIPVGPVGGYQELWRITRVNESEYQSTSLGGVRFVPLTREVREE